MVIVEMKLRLNLRLKLKLMAVLRFHHHVTDGLLLLEYIGRVVELLFYRRRLEVDLILCWLRRAGVFFERRRRRRVSDGHRRLAISANDRLKTVQFVGRYARRVHDRLRPITGHPRIIEHMLL